MNVYHRLDRDALAGAVLRAGPQLLHLDCAATVRTVLNLIASIALGVAAAGAGQWIGVHL